MLMFRQSTCLNLNLTPIMLTETNILDETEKIEIGLKKPPAEFTAGVYTL